MYRIKKNSLLIYVCFLNSIITLCSLRAQVDFKSRTETKAQAQLLTKHTVFTAGSYVLLQFDTSVPAILICHSSYGNSVINYNQKLGKGHYILPPFLASKKGIVDYKLVYKNTPISEGNITIVAHPNQNRYIESYVGPPSISAGGNDYTMMVVIPTDTLDNPLEARSPVSIKHQFLNNRINDTQNTLDLIAWKNIFSYTTSGRLLVAATTKEALSKEFSVEVFPAQPMDFTINYHQKHSYADGNQITVVTTSVINDRYKNIISDGTLVNFVVKEANNKLLTTQSSTINGVATAKILHPDHPASWQIVAYINGMANSNSIQLNYKSATAILPVFFSRKNRKMTIGPLQSFMGQLIPDGTIVKLLIFKNNRFLETKQKTTHQGVTVFTFEEGFYTSGMYSFTIKALGLEKKYQNIKL